jgi:hypothetical protein
MHCISLGYPIISAIIGAYYDAYADTSTYMGCWVNCPPGKNEEECISKRLGWIFYGWPFLFVVASLTVNNLMIWFLVHGQSVTLRNKSTSSGVVVSSDESAAVDRVDDDDSFRNHRTRIDETFNGSDTTPSSDNANNAQMQTSEFPTDKQLSPSTVDSRWSPDYAKERNLLASLDSNMPQRVSSTAEIQCTEDALSGPSTDIPLQTPIRTRSLELDSEIENEETNVSLQASPLPPPARPAPSVEASSDRMLRPPARRMSPPP